MQAKKSKFQSSLANIVKNHRIMRKRSMSKFSDEIGLTKSVWSSIEAGNRDPQLTTIWRFAEALSIPLSQIIIELEQELGEDFFLET